MRDRTGGGRLRRRCAPTGSAVFSLMRLCWLGAYTQAEGISHLLGAIIHRKCDRGDKLALQCVLAGGIVLASFFANGHLAHASCGNEAIRDEQGAAALPDCRAYEQVTPSGNDSAEPKAVIGGFSEATLASPPGMHSSISGDRMAWTSEYSSSQSAGLDYLSTRGSDRWLTEDVIPPQTVQNGLNCTAVVAITAYSPDLSRGVLADGLGQAGSGEEFESLDCGHDDPLLASGEQAGTQNLFVRDNENTSYQLINVTPAGAPDPKFPASFQAGSADLSHIVFEEALPLAEGAGSGDELYDYFNHVVRLVSYLPGGIPVHGVLAGSTVNADNNPFTNEPSPYNLADYRHAMSADGSRVFFEAEGNLYTRANPEQPPVEECANSTKACSVQVDQAQGTATGPSGGGKFMVASEDGSRVFFTDSNRLTTNSKAEPGKPDLYEYNFDRAQDSQLLDLTTGSGGPGEVLGVSGASENDEAVYFVAQAVLTAGQQNTSGAGAQAGDPNLYLAKGGAITFIASLDPDADDCDWNTACLTTGSIHDGAGGLTARTSGNGAFVAFDSDLSLTGYHNEGPACVPIQHGTPEIYGYAPGRCEEIYLYSASKNKLECISCDPDGHAPIGPADIPYASGASQEATRNAYLQRNISESGQVFFESRDPLVPAASNGRLNVYEYENGQAHLISSGTGESDSYFLEASPDGRNVFFATSKDLLRNGPNAVYRIYDARVEGGFAEEPHAVVPCEGEECRGAFVPPPVFAVPATVNFSEVAAAPQASKKAAAKAKQRKKQRHKRRRRHVSGAKQHRASKTRTRGGQ